MKSILVEATLKNVCAQVKISQTYQNTNTENPIEAIYRFPLEKNAAISAFEAEIDGNRLIGKIEEKEKTQELYTDAIASGNVAFMVQQEQDGEKAQVFSLAIGNIPPQKSASVSITYVTELNLDSKKAIRFLLPTTISPDLAKEIDEDESDNAGYSRTEAGNPCDFKIIIDAHMSQGISSISCPSHPAALKLDQENPADNTKANLSMTFGTSALVQDIIVLFHLEKVHQATALVEKWPSAPASDSPSEFREKAIMLGLIPGFNHSTVFSEIIFVVDRSGSMSGQKIQVTKTALQYFLKSLPENCYFNIIGFGSNFEQVFPQSLPYNAPNLQVATAAVAKFSADLGGTELLNPLKSIFLTDPKINNLRNIFILTDGEIDSKYAPPLFRFLYPIKFND